MLKFTVPQQHKCATKTGGDPSNTINQVHMCYLLYIFRYTFWFQVSHWWNRWTQRTGLFPRQQMMLMTLQGQRSVLGNIRERQVDQEWGGGTEKLTNFTGCRLDFASYDSVKTEKELTQLTCYTHTHTHTHTPRVLCTCWWSWCWVRSHGHTLAPAPACLWSPRRTWRGWCVSNAGSSAQLWAWPLWAWSLRSLLVWCSLSHCTWMGNLDICQERLTSDLSGMSWTKVRKSLKLLCRFKEKHIILKEMKYWIMHLGMAACIFICISLQSLSSLLGTPLQ